MIEILIKIKEGKVYNKFSRKHLTFDEAACALLRLKQIEQELINLEFKNDLEVFEE